MAITRNAGTRRTDPLKSARDEQNSVIPSECENLKNKFECFFKR